MVKFSNGMWWNADGATIDWATEVVKSEVVAGDRIRCVTSTKHINHRGDILNNPTITLECSSPVPGTFLFKAHHWKAQKKTERGPHYELYSGRDVNELIEGRTDAPTASKSETHLTLTTKTLQATIDTRPASLSVEFSSHNHAINPKEQPRMLTKLGWRSIGYVRRWTTTHLARGALTDPDAGDRWFTMQFQLSVGEKIYGLGERFGPFVKNGQSIEMWNEDGGSSSELAYKNVPFYLSSRGYGIFIPFPGVVSFEVQSERTTRVNIAVQDESLSAYIIYGPTPKDIIERYTLITGRPALPPLWTFGLWLSTSFTTDYDEKTVTGFLDEMKAQHIPVAVLHFDCFWQRGFHWCEYEFDKQYFPDAPGQLRRLKEKGYKVSVWINPYIAQESKIFDEGVTNGYFIKKPDGSVFQTDWWQAGMGFIDFTNPKACAWYQTKLKNLIDIGVDCFKTDFGERIPTGNVVYYDSSDPEKMHNYYSFLYNKTTFDLLEECLGKNSAAVFARSATAGGQRFPVHWGGDPMSTFEAMAETLRGGLSLGLCGFGFWAHDIGGFEGTPDPALYMRWFAFGALSSHSRLHGSGSYRVPWLIDPSGKATKVVRFFTRIKLSLMLYIYLIACIAHRKGIPVLRAMFLEFPDDPTVWGLDTQYMLGNALLVAPVFCGVEEQSEEQEAQAKESDQETEVGPYLWDGFLQNCEQDVRADKLKGEVEYYVPAGRWYGILDRKMHIGPAWVRERHGFMSIPLLLRPSSVILLNGSEGPEIVVHRYACFTLLINPGDEGLDKVVEIPDVNDPEKPKMKIKVNAGWDKVSVHVEEGESAVVDESWRICLVQKCGKLAEMTVRSGSLREELSGACQCNVCKSSL